MKGLAEPSRGRLPARRQRYWKHDNPLIVTSAPA
jgi:hypothetical protein